jgi:hypothetical protein
MRSTLRLVYTSMALATIGCGPSIEVRTMAAPDRGLAGLHTFQMLPSPTRRDGRPATGSDDPMISNSIANRAIREHIERAFLSRGYLIAERNPDFAIAFYATARERLDVTLWDYGYPFYPAWPRYGRPVQTVTEYTEGSVIIDGIDARTRELLWRGEGKARLSTDMSKNVELLAKAAEAIIDKFPQAERPLVAARP